MNSVADVWDNVLKELKSELSETTIATWFDELEAVEIQGNTFILHCSNDFKKGYIESLFMKNIKAALHDIFSMDFEVKILDDPGFAEFNGESAGRQSDQPPADLRGFGPWQDPPALRHRQRDPPQRPQSQDRLHQGR